MANKKDNLELREEKDGYFSVIDLKNVQCKTIDEAYKWLELGLQKRQTSSTAFN